MRFEDITVLQYQTLYSISKSDLDEWDKVTESVAVISGKTPREVDDMPVPEFNKLAHEVVKILSTDIKPEPKRLVKANSKTYGITYEPAKLRAGQYVEIQHFLQGGLIENLHYLLASLSYPITKQLFWTRKLPNNSDNHSEVANDFLQAKMIDAYSSCVFFCDLLKVSINSLRDFLARETKMETQKIDKLLTDFNSVMDGSIQPNKLQNTRE